MNCNNCGNLMANSTTVFTVVKDDEIYVVKDAPCLECPVCGHIAYTQDASKTLERYLSGRLIPAKTSRAWVFGWNDPIIEIPKIGSVTSTVTPSIGVTVSGT